MSSSTKTSGSTATKQQATPAPQAGHAQPCVPHEKIAMRAYAKWQQRGCPCGTDLQDWREAEAELKAEMTRGNSTPAASAAKPAQRR